MGKVTFLGVEGSGKTVLTMALVDAFKLSKGEGWVLRPDSRESYRFLMQQTPRFEKGELPNQTAEMKRMAWTVLHNGNVVRELDVLDYPGEIYRLAFLDAEDEADPDAFRERLAAHQKEVNGLLRHLVDSDQVFVLFNLDDAMRQDTNSKNVDAVWVTNACLDFLFRLSSHPRVTFLLTQMDRFSDQPLDQIDMRACCEKYLPLIADNFPQLEIVPLAALNPNTTANGIAEIVQRILLLKYRSLGRSFLKMPIKDEQAIQKVCTEAERILPLPQFTLDEKILDEVAYLDRQITYFKQKLKKELERKIQEIEAQKEKVKRENRFCSFFIIIFLVVVVVLPACVACCRAGDCSQSVVKNVDADVPESGRKGERGKDNGQ